jgi:CheY-like chemotaxis protein
MKAAEPPPAGDGCATAAPTTILVVEDEALVLLAVGEFLRESGYRVLEAANGDEAVAILQRGEPADVVFSDVRMPGKLNGFGLARWVRDNRPDLRMLLMSGYTGLAKPADGVDEDGEILEKPFTFATLLRHLQRLTGQHSAS